MALRNFSKIPCNSCRFLDITQNSNTFLNCPSRKTITTTASTCPNTTCGDEQKKEKQGLFKSLSEVFGKKPSYKTKPPIESCRLRQVPDDECKPDPDLSQFEGTIYKTCAGAYIVQRDMLPSKPTEISKEDKILLKIEANVGSKDRATDPMPEFTSVEQRMIDLNERKLHPFYKRYMNVPKRIYKGIQNETFYQTRSGPINPYEIPVQLKYNRELLEKKNMYADYKRVEPPQQLLGKIVEMRKNERPTLKKKVPVVPEDAQASTKKAVFETLYQKEIKF